MKKSEVSFRYHGNSGPLSIYWFDGPYGDAEEALKGKGVCWYSPNGELLGVEFDDVEKKSDDQTLVLRKGQTVSVKVRNGKVKFELSKIKKVG